MMHFQHMLFNPLCDAGLDKIKKNGNVGQG